MDKCKDETTRSIVQTKTGLLGGAGLRLSGVREDGEGVVYGKRYLRRDVLRCKVISE